jgi:hypothetical protein
MRGRLRALRSAAVTGDPETPRKTIVHGCWLCREPVRICLPCRWMARRAPRGPWEAEPGADAALITTIKANSAFPRGELCELEKRPSPLQC